MRAILIIGTFLITFYSGLSQDKAIPIFKIYSTEVKGLMCIDSSKKISTNCSLGINGISITFFYASMDYSKQTIRIIGRVGIGKGYNSIGVANIEIYKGVKINDEIKNEEVLGRSVYDQKFINNDGFFDVSFTIRPKESLFFQGTGYYIKEFATFKLFK